MGSRGLGGREGCESGAGKIPGDVGVDFCGKGMGGGGGPDRI